MADVLHGNASGNQLNVGANRTQAYGLAGNDTIASDGKSDVLLVGGSGNDSLVMSGGNGTLSGGVGSDTFVLNYSATQTLSAVIEDIEPSNDSITVNFDGTVMPALTSVVSGNDLVLNDGGGRLNVTLKGVRDNDYFDGDASDEAWEVLRLTNSRRETAGLPALTMSDGLTKAAEIRVQEITELDDQGLLDIFKHERPYNKGGYSTVFDEVGKKYSSHAENITAGESTAAEAVADLMNSPTHKRNILDEENRNYSKLGVGYKYFDNGSLSSQRYYWEQLFGSSLYSPAPETVSTTDLLSATPEVHTVSKAVTGTDGDDNLNNGVLGATIDALGGNDTITNSGLNVSISGGADNDTLTNTASFVTISAGTGDDSIQLSGTAHNNLIQYAAGDGNDTVSGFDGNDTLGISGEEFTPATVGNNVVVAVGDDSITLINAARISTLHIDGRQKNFFRGTERADNMNNTVEGAIIAALGGNDTITNYGDNVSINAGAGNDYITDNWNNKVVFFHESGNDTIQGFGSNSTLKVAGGKYVSLVNDSNFFDLILIDSESGDSINLLGAAYQTINIADAEGNPVTVGNARNIVGTEGADSLANTFDNATIRALGGDDTINNNGVWSSIFGGAGDDSISNSTIQVTIDAGAGNDSISNNAAQVTINGGAGDDYLNNNEQLITTYIYEGGNDTVEGFNASDTLNVGGYSYATVESGEDILVNVLRGSATVGTVTLKDYSGQYVNIVSTYTPATVRGRTISNANDSVSVTGTAGNDTITNSGNDVTIAGGKGNDQISLGGGAANNRVQYSAGDGFDTVSGFNATSTLRIDDGDGSFSSVASGSDVLVRVGNGSVLLDGAASLGSSLNVEGYESEISGSIIPLTEGDDTHSNYDSDVTILALGGDDSVYSSSDNVSIDGGADNDTINFNGINVTVTGGNGNDSIYDGTDIAAHVYTGGNDTIYGFDRWSTIVIADRWTSVSGDDGIVLAVLGKGSLTLDDYWRTDTKIVSSLDDVTHYNRLYSDGDNTVVTGTSDADHLGLWNDSVTVDAAGGDDHIFVGEANDSINGGAGDDTVRMDTAANTTVEGGTGKNLFTQWGSAGIAYVYGGGNDTIEDYNQLQTLVIADSWSSVRNDYNGTTTINVKGKGTITLLYPSDDINIVSSLAEAKRYNFIRNNDSSANVTGTGSDDFIKNHSSATVNAAGGDDVVHNWGYYSSINGNAGDDSINNLGSNNVTIDGGTGDDTLNNYWGATNVVLNGDAGNDEINNNNRGSFVTMNGGAGNDYLWNSGANVTINGNADDDRVYSYGSHNSSIDGGAGNDYILQGWHDDDSIFGDDSTLTGGDGDDTIENAGGKNVSILGGNGNDHIQNEVVTRWNRATQQEETVSSPDNTTIDGGEGDDNIYNEGGRRVSISGGNGNDHIQNEVVTRWNSTTQQSETVNSPDNTTIDGGEGNDYIYNHGSNVSIDGGAGSDTIYNDGGGVIVRGGADSDNIYNYGSNVSMLGGAGNDQIRLSGDSRNNLVRYDMGDGNDTVWGMTENDTLNFLADESLVSPAIRDGEDLIINVGTGSVRLVGAWNKPPHITYGESNTEGGRGGQGGGGQDGGGRGDGGGGRGNTSGGTSASEGRGSDASGGTSASGRGGSSSGSRGGASGGGGNTLVSRAGNYRPSTTSTATEVLKRYNEMLSQAGQPQQPSLPVAAQHVYTGGNQVIANYQSGEKIIFGAQYTGAFYDGAGNFLAGSSTGALAIQNAADKVIDLSDAAGNAFVKAYAATNAGLIDGRGIAGFELINGSAGSDTIFAGDGGSQLWGGADNVTDILVGGGGADIFVGGRTQGADVFLNASSADVVHLNDATLSDIVATAEDNGVVAVAFNTGNVIAAQSTEALSSTFMLADGSAYRYNHVNKSWQNA